MRKRCGRTRPSGRESSDAAKVGQVSISPEYPEKPLQISCVGSLTYAYLQAGNTQKICRNTAKTEIALVPNDVSTLRAAGTDAASNLAWKRIRARCPCSAGQSGTIFQAAIEITPTLPKPGEPDR